MNVTNLVETERGFVIGLSYFESMKLKTLINNILLETFFIEV